VFAPLVVRLVAVRCPGYVGTPFPARRLVGLFFLATFVVLARVFTLLLSHDRPVPFWPRRTRRRRYPAPEPAVS
jgi:hypothetical protein